MTTRIRFIYMHSRYACDKSHHKSDSRFQENVKCWQMFFSLEFVCLVEDDAESNGTGHTGDDHG